MVRLSARRLSAGGRSVAYVLQAHFRLKDSEQRLQQHENETESLPLGVKTVEKSVLGDLEELRMTCAGEADVSTSEQRLGSVLVTVLDWDVAIMSKPSSGIADSGE